ncbi:MAG: hypothetical protein K0R36_878 [Chryseobacterium sp.]|jgi:hypothetical protein|nr:hypothetical protein [Chryseobacterium sp.]
MIYTLNYPTHLLERVNQVIYEFIKNSTANCNYSRDLFPEWFRDVLAKSKSQTGSKNFENKFEDVHQAMQDLDIDVRIRIFELFDEGLDIKSLCNDRQKEVILTENYPELHEKLKIVIKEHFYGIALNSNKTIEEKLGTSLKKHYIEFKTKNREGRVCPFCGLHEYGLLDGEAKDDYDHLLYKEKYPLYAVNFSNLVPMCKSCNQSGVKGTEDVLYDENTGLRRTSYYPYESNLGVKISVDNFSSVEYLSDILKEKFPFGYFSLSITHNAIDDEEKVNTWKTVFKINTRFNSYLSEYYSFTKDDFHDYYLPDHPEITLDDNIQNLRDIILNFRNQLGNNKRKTAVDINKAYLDFISLLGNEHLLYTFCKINLLDYN